MNTGANTPALSDTTAAQAFAALGSPQRLAVMRTLVRAGPGGLSMGALAERTQTRASTLTHHIRFLTDADLVTQTKQGRSIICAAASFEIVENLASYLLAECCSESPALSISETAS